MLRKSKAAAAAAAHRNASTRKEKGIVNGNSEELASLLINGAAAVTRVPGMLPAIVDSSLTTSALATYLVFLVLLLEIPISIF